MRDPQPHLPDAADAPERRAARVSDIVLFVRRYRRTLLVPVLLLAALALAYVLTATPLYTADARLLVDARGSDALQSDPGSRETIIDAAAMESHVEAVQSERILLSAVDALGPDDAPVPTPGLFGRLLGRAPVASGDGERRLAAAERLRGMLTVRRVGQSRLIEVVAQTPNPERSARVANAVADAYVREQVAFKARMAGQAARWLEQQAADLGRQLNAATQAVQELKARNDLVETGGRGLIAEQRVAERNTQLAQATTQTADARARLERIEAVLAADPRDAASPEALRSEVITRLRQDYLDAATREADLTARYGPDHPVVQRLRDSLRDIGAAIAAELRRIADSARGEYEIARAREEAAAAALKEAVDKAAEAKQAQARIQELESSAEITRKNYQKALERYAAAVQQQTFPIAEATVASPAVPPLRKSHPKPALTLALAGVLGAVIGLGAATMRNHLNHGVRRPQEVIQALSLPCLAMVPMVGRRARGDLLRGVDTMPLSRFADALREVKTTLEVERAAERLRSVGVLSLLPGEGGSTLAANLAALFAGSGVRTLLVDADLRKASLTAGLGHAGQPGLADLMDGRTSAAEAERPVGGGGFAFLPAAAAAPVGASSDRLGSTAFRSLVEGLTERYDLALFDLPPLRALPDARAAAPALDGVVLVAAYGRTPLDLLRESVALLDNMQVRVVGVVLNKVDPYAVRQDLGHAVDYR